LFYRRIQDHKFRQYGHQRRTCRSKRGCRLNPLADIRRAALDYLARREHSELELSRKLRAKGFEAADIQGVLSTLSNEGLLNHTRFVENYIHYRRNRGYGPVRIRAELLERGIAENLIVAQLNIADNTWLDLGREVRTKRFKSVLPLDFKQRAQQMRFLHYRGFTRDQIDIIFHSDD